MNRVFLIGRLTRDPDVRYTQGSEPMAVARYTLAVDRITRSGEDRKTDFVGCVAFGKRGEFAEKHLSKGMKIAVEGHIQTGSYDHKDGYKVYTTDVVVDNHYFCERRGERSEGQELPPEMPADEDGFVNIPDDIGDDLPFR